MRRIVLATTALLALAIVYSATPQGASPTPAVTSTVVFEDGNDGISGPDVKTVTVSDDKDGTIHLAIAYWNRQCITSDDLVQIAMNTDGNASTGQAPFGLDYAIVLDGASNGAATLSKWSTYSFEAVPSSTLTSTCDSTPANAVSIKRTEIGSPDAFDFTVLTFDGNTLDAAPDNSAWHYTLSKGSPTPPPPPPPPPGGPPPPPPPGTPPPPPPPGDPDAAFGADAPPHYVGQRVRFDAVTFGAASYTWKFGDGREATTTVPVAYHRYAAAGTYTVTLDLKRADSTQAEAAVLVEVVPVTLSSAKLPTIAGPSARSRKDPTYSRAASKAAGGSRAVLCWAARDWAILEGAFDPDATGGFVDPSKLRQINLSPPVCAGLDRIAYGTRRPAPTLAIARGAFVLARGVEESKRVKPAAAACYALQLAPSVATLLGADPAYGKRLGKLLAARYARGLVAKHDRSAACRDGGPLDLDRAHRHWP